MTIRERLQQKAVDRGLVEPRDDLLVTYHPVHGYMVRLRKVDSHWVRIGATLHAAEDRLEQMKLGGLE